VLPELIQQHQIHRPAPPGPPIRRHHPPLPLISQLDTVRPVIQPVPPKLPHQPPAPPNIGGHLLEHRFRVRQVLARQHRQLRPRAIRRRPAELVSEQPPQRQPLQPAALPVLPGNQHQQKLEPEPATVEILLQRMHIQPPLPGQQPPPQAALQKFDAVITPGPLPAQPAVRAGAAGDRRGEHPRRHRPHHRDLRCHGHRANRFR